MLVLIFLIINLEHGGATNVAVKLRKEYKTGQKVTNGKTSLLIKCSQQDHTQVSFLNMLIFYRMLFEENLEWSFDIDLFISVVYFGVYLLTSGVFFL